MRLSATEEGTIDCRHRCHKTR